MNDLGRRGGCLFWFLPLSLMLLIMIYASSASAMGDNLIGQVFDQIQQKITDAWEAVFDPIYWWYFLLGIGFLVALAIAIFVPFKYVRLTLGLLLALGAAFVAGGRQMGKSYKERLAREREKVRELEARRREQGGSSSGGGWSNWFGS